MCSSRVSLAMPWPVTGASRIISQVADQSCGRWLVPRSVIISGFRASAAAATSTTATSGTSSRRFMVMIGSAMQPTASATRVERR